MKSIFGVLAAAVLASACSSTPPRGGDSQALGAEVRPAVTGPAGTAERLRTHTDLAVEYFRRGNHAIALQELNTVLQLDARYVPAHNVLGLIYLQIRDTAAAGRHLRQALELAPQDPDTLNNYGWYLCETGEPRAALSYFERATVNPLFSGIETALLNAGICALRAKAPEDAERYLSRLADRQPEAALPQHYLGRAAFDRGNTRAAKAFAERAGALAPPSPENLWLLARIERKLNNPSAGGPLEAQLLKLFPNSPEARELTGR